ncbi:MULTISPECIES: ABC transporter permease [Microbacterium]|uniref:ABC transporter permease n=1 Tax=Microbacterium aquimaris TaxID=459816 RepID=A0ABU5N2B5_9MICO|nr:MULTISPECIES: ABC transporter permease [Microbacterium]MDZ8160223.1 ABC transporter permease [Microbacterium aquimaris]MDZ8200209.1 ABC transporter permease [Microbacterium sp. SSW1-59]
MTSKTETAAVGIGSLRSRWRPFVATYRVEMVMFVALLVLVVALAILQPRFLTSSNMQNVLSQVMVLGIIAIGQTLVVLTGGIDLSVGGIAALSIMAGGLVMVSGGVVLGVVVMLGVGLLAGLMNGLLIAYLRLAPFIVTLGMLSITSSLTYVISDGRSLFGLPEAFDWFGKGNIAGIKFYVILFVVLYIAAHIFLTRTKPGRFIYSIGSNAEAARLSGIRVSFYQVIPYALTGLLCALAMMIESSRLGTIDPNTGTGFELSTIAAVVIGGASLMGGRGSVVGTVIGIFLIGFLQNGLNILGVNAFWQGTALGVVIILAVVLDRVVRPGRR